MMDLKTFAVDIARGVYANDEKFALVELQGLWTEIQKKANVEPPVDLRAAVRQLVEEWLASKQVNMLTRFTADDNWVTAPLIDRISTFVAERELARDERAAGICQELVILDPDHEKYIPGNGQPCGWCHGLEKATERIRDKDTR